MYMVSKQLYYYIYGEEHKNTESLSHSLNQNKFQREQRCYVTNEKQKLLEESMGTYIFAAVEEGTLLSST